MGAEVLLYGYGLVCASMLVFNLLYGLHLRSDDRRMERRTGRLRRQVEKQLAGEPFARCNACYLVNLRYVTQIQGYSVYLGEEELRISHPKRKDFAAAFAAYTAGGRKQ